MRQLYLKHEKFQTLSGKLSWSHYTELLSISDDLARSFYEKQCEKDGWSVRELKRQRDSGLFERLALSRDKKGVLELARTGQIIETGKDDIFVEYATGSISNQVFVSRYQIHLPDKNELERELKLLLEQEKREP